MVGDELAQFDHGSLEVGLDPFDPAVLPTLVPLPSGTVSVTASEDGQLIVATVGSDLVGIVDGEEVWTWTPDVEGIGVVLLVDGFVGVREIVGGVFGRWCSPRSETAVSFLSTRFPMRSDSRTCGSPLTEALPLLESSMRHLTCVLGTNVFVQQLWSCGLVRRYRDRG